MGRHRKNKRPKEPTREERISTLVAKVLDSDRVTPAMIYDLMLHGHMAYKQGMGLSHNQVWEAILLPFRQRGRKYLSPYQMAALREHDEPELEDFDHLHE